MKLKSSKVISPPFRSFFLAIVLKSPCVLIDIKSEFRKAKSVFNRVRDRHGSTSKTPPKVQSTPSSSSGIALSTTSTSSPSQQPSEKTKVKMSFELVALLVYTVGVKCRGINKKEEYAPEHVFSLSENTANRLLKQSMMDLIKHNRSHVVRIYPKGTRIGSTNYEPHRYWSAGAQLVAINWQTMGEIFFFGFIYWPNADRSFYVGRFGVYDQSCDVSTEWTRGLCS